MPAPPCTPCLITAAVLVATAAMGLASCGGASDAAAAPVTVSTAADLGTINPGDSVQLAAIVSNDSAARGVSWSLSCPNSACGSLAPTATASGVPTTYTAPAARPPSDLAVRLIATSVADPGATATTRVTVAGGMAISMSCSAATVAGGTSTQCIATVVNDPDNGGITWTLSCPAAPCGEISPTHTASGAPTRYTAPATPLGSDLAVTVSAVSATNAAVSASGALTVPGLTVVVDPNTATLAAGTTVQLTATVSNDAAGAGITWSVQCDATDCGRVNPASSASAAPVTYSAPAAAPPKELRVTLLAVSVSAPRVQGEATITVPPIAVGITPISALLPRSARTAFTGAVSNDPTAGGISWTLSQNGAACADACGTLSLVHTANGGMVLYTAPDSLPAQPMVTVTATSATDSSQVANATVILTAGSVQLVPADMAFIKKRKGVFPPPQTATLTNTGAAALTVSGLTVGGSKPGAFSQSNTCGSSLAARRSCDITVKYNPIKGQGTAVLAIADSSSDSPQQLHLSGTVQYSVSAAMRSALAGQATAAVPRPSGAQRVGTRLLHLVDPARSDPYLRDGSPRELMLRVWYPAAAASGCAVAEYTAPQVWGYFGELLGASLPQVATNSCLEAAPDVEPHPVVVLSHGFTGTATDYTFLAEDLASRGYVVVSVGHTGEATAVEFPDGRLEKSLFGSHLTQYLRSDSASLALAVSVRLGDLRAVLDELERRNSRPGEPLAGTLDLTRIAVMGHSLGGLTALRAMEDEPRFKAGVVLDPVMPPHLARPMHQPLLLLVAGRQGWNEDDCRLWDGLRGPRLAVNLRGAEHVALSDAVWLLQGTVRTGTAQPSRAVAIIRSYVAGFLDDNLAAHTQHGRVDSAAALDYPEVAASRADTPLCELHQRD